MTCEVSWEGSKGSGIGEKPHFLSVDWLPQGAGQPSSPLQLTHHLQPAAAQAQQSKCLFLAYIFSFSH